MYKFKINERIAEGIRPRYVITLDICTKIRKHFYKDTNLEQLYLISLIQTLYKNIKIKIKRAHKNME